MGVAHNSNKWSHIHENAPDPDIFTCILNGRAAAELLPEGGAHSGTDCQFLTHYKIYILYKKNFGAKKLLF